MKLGLLEEVNKLTNKMARKTKLVRIPEEIHDQIKFAALLERTTMSHVLEKKLSEEAPDEPDEYFVIVTNKEVDEIATDKIGRKLTEEERFEFAGPVFNETMGAISDIISDMAEAIDDDREDHPEPPKVTSSTVDDF